MSAPPPPSSQYPPAPPYQPPPPYQQQSPYRPRPYDQPPPPQKPKSRKRLVVAVVVVVVVVVAVAFAAVLITVTYRPGGSTGFTTSSTTDQGIGSAAGCMTESFPAGSTVSVTWSVTTQWPATLLVGNSAAGSFPVDEMETSEGSATFTASAGSYGFCSAISYAEILQAPPDAVTTVVWTASWTSVL